MTCVDCGRRADGERCVPCYNTRLLGCPGCRGLGEVPVPGTYGPTISPEHLETRNCPRCHGKGEA